MLVRWSIALKVNFKSSGNFMEELPIGEIARQAGIRPSALRYYESIGLLPTPKRVNGRRRYDQRTVQMLRVVQLAQHAGFTVAEIQMLLHGFAPDTPPAARWQALAHQKLRELDTVIAHAQQRHFLPADRQTRPVPHRKSVQRCGHGMWFRDSTDSRRW